MCNSSLALVADERIACGRGNGHRRLISALRGSRPGLDPVAHLSAVLRLRVCIRRLAALARAQRISSKRLVLCRSSIRNRWTEIWSVHAQRNHDWLGHAAALLPGRNSRLAQGRISCQFAMVHMAADICRRMPLAASSPAHHHDLNLAFDVAIVARRRCSHRADCRPVQRRGHDVADRGSHVTGPASGRVLSRDVRPPRSFRLWLPGSVHIPRDPIGNA
mmetsp:Transcript_9959/g.25755  ORF Transcript_9959/g.25755 Transcript_9959/m.25755 type:complete len:219 (-) Transcript_9959:759-1415(-)